jgi:hypothetical protein
MKSKFQLFTGILVLLIIACHPTSYKSGPATLVDSIYFGGDIITMEGDSAVYAEAIAVRA